MPTLANQAEALLQRTPAAAATRHNLNGRIPGLPPEVELFLSAMFEGFDLKSVHLASVPGDPNYKVNQSWFFGGRWGSGYTLDPGANLYFSMGVLDPDSNGRGQRIVIAHVGIVLDDVGTKVSREKVEALRALGFEPIAIVETSPGNFQYFFKFLVPVREGEADREAQQVLRAVRHYLKLGSWGDEACFDPVRYARLPGGINGKGKYAEASGGTAPQVQMVEFNPKARVVLEDLAAFLMGPDWKKEALAGAYVPLARAVGDAERRGSMDDPMVQLAAAVGLNPRPSTRAGVIDCDCPNGHNHTDGNPDGFAFINTGGRCFCNHGHCQHLDSASFHEIIKQKYRDLVALGQTEHATPEDFLRAVVFEQNGIGTPEDMADVQAQLAAIEQGQREKDRSRDDAVARLEDRFIYVRSQDQFFDTETRSLIDASQLDRTPEVVAVWPVGGKAKDKASNALINSGRLRTVFGITRDARLGAGLVVDADTEIGLTLPMLNIYQPTRLGRRQGVPQAWLDLLAYIIPNPRDRQLFEEGVAYAIQNPHLPMPIIIMLIGRPGIGKDMIMRVVQAIVGLHNSTLATPAGLMSSYNEWQTFRLVMLDEFSTHGFPDLHERLRAWTSPTPVFATINPKYGKQFRVRVNPWFMGTSNDADALKGLQAGDRRWMIIMSDADRLHGPGHGSGPGTDDWYTKLNIEFAKPEFLEMVHERLMTMQIALFDPNKAPITSNRHEAHLASLSGAARWVHEQVTAGLFEAREVFLTKEIEDAAEVSSNQHAKRFFSARALRDGLALTNATLLGRVRIGRARRRIWSGHNVSSERLAELQAMPESALVHLVQKERDSDPFGSSGATPEFAVLPGGKD